MVVFKISDDKIWEAIKNDILRQSTTINLIASENYASEEVIKTVGTVLMNKYSEGYPKKRYYGGNQFIDVCEQLAIDRANKLFGSEHANVQPNAGSPANMAAFFALTDWLRKGKKIMGMKIDQGGHLTHGSPVNFSGILFDIVPYGVDKETHLIDMDDVRRIAEREKPNILLAGATSYPREIDFEEFGEIAKDVGASFMTDISHIAGLIVAGVHKDAVKYSDVVMTTTHKTLRGPRGAILLCKNKYAEAVDKAVFPGMQGGPLDNIIAAKAVCFGEAMKPEFKEYGKKIVKNAKTLAETLINGGMRIITNGTDNHLILADVTPLGLTGKEVEIFLDGVGITVNKNVIPYDTRTPWNPSGIRIGTAALTTRGMGKTEMKLIGEWMITALKNHNNQDVLEEIKGDVKELCLHFPVYKNLMREYNDIK